MTTADRELLAAIRARTGERIGRVLDGAVGACGVVAAVGCVAGAMTAAWWMWPVLVVGAVGHGLFAGDRIGRALCGGDE